MFEILITILLTLLTLSVSCGITCGLIWLICLCFGVTFSLRLAIGCWLLVLILRPIFGGRK